MNIHPCNLALSELDNILPWLMAIVSNIILSEEDTSLKTK